MNYELDVDLEVLLHLKVPEDLEVPEDLKVLRHSNAANVGYICSIVFENTAWDN